MRVIARRASSHLILLLLCSVSAPAVASEVRDALASHGGQPQTDALGRIVRTTNGDRQLFDGPTGEPRPAMGKPSTATAPATTKSVATGDLPLHLEWYRPTMGSPIGLQGLAVVDLDGDGIGEIVVTSGADTWMILRRQGDQFEQQWASLPSASAIRSLRVATIGGEPIIVIGHADGTLELVDPTTHQAFRTISTSATDFRGLTIADVAGSGAPDAVFCDAAHIYEIDLQTGDAVRPPLAMSCVDLAVGQVDDDPGLEIAVATETDPAYVLDAATFDVKWTNNLGFGNQVAVGDLDGDGRDEIAAGHYWYDGITVFNAESHSIAFEVSIFNLATMTIADVDGDARPDLLYGDAQWGSVHAIDGTTGQEKWYIENPEHGVTSIAIGNVDDDPAREVLWGAGHTSSGPDYLYVGDSVTHLREWQSDDITGPFYAVGGGDLAGDGHPKIFYGSFSSNSGYDGGWWFIHDGATKALEHKGPVDSNAPWGGIWRMASADVTGSTAHEIFTAGAYLYDGELSCRDLDGNLLWSHRSDDSTSYRGLALADVDDDQHLDLVTATGAESTGSTGTHVFVLDAATGTPEWTSPSMGSSDSYSMLRVANVDDDPALEAVAAANGGRVWVWDLSSHLDQQVTLDLDTSALDVAHIDGSAPDEIVIGTNDGYLKKIDVTQGTATTLFGPLGLAVSSLLIHDFTDDGVPDFLVALGTHVDVVDGVDGTVRWSSGYLDYLVGASDNLRLGDFDGDGKIEILTASSRGILMFGNDDRSPGLLSDGFETGGFFKWSAE